MKKFFKDTFRFFGALLALVRGIMLLCMLAVGIMTVYFIYTTAMVTINQYNKTLTWQNTTYGAPRAEIEPALVSNMIDKDTLSAATAWEELDSYLDSLDGQSIPDRERADKLIEDAVHWREIYNLESPSIDRLSLYLQLEDAITDAYVTLDSGKLRELGVQLYNMELEETTESGQRYVERIREVSADFASVKSLMSDTVWSVGTVENGTWTIPYTYTRTDLTEILDKLQTMEKFPAIGNVTDVLSDISIALNYNKNARDYFAYQQFKENMAGMRRSGYVSVSSIYTYSQALAYGCSVEPVQQDGYTVSLDSPVTGVYYNGERLDDNEYIRIGAPVTVTLSEIYEQVVPSGLDLDFTPTQAPDTYVEPGIYENPENQTNQTWEGEDYYEQGN